MYDLVIEIAWFYKTLSSFLPIIINNNNNKIIVNIATCT